MAQVDWPGLLDAARRARERAYVPYSHFKVGAALLGRSGTIYPGCNVENAAYPVCMCAERTALCAAIATGERDFIALAVIADAPRPVPPCGMCRQALLELAPDIAVLLANLDGAERETTPHELLPDGFRMDDLPPEAR